MAGEPLGPLVYPRLHSKFRTPLFFPSFLSTAAQQLIRRPLQSLFAFTVLIFNLIWRSVAPGYGGRVAAGQSFSYFTILTYWGLAFYFLFASIHTFSYARTGTPLLNRWPRALQTLHSFYYTTVTTYPFLVTIVYWAVLYTGPWFPKQFDAYSNISQHALNSLFALIEIFLPRTSPRPWIHLPFLIILLALYLGLAYLTRATQGFYVYGFLDPANGKGKLVGYVFGIAAGITVIFALVKGLMWVRKWATEKKMGRTGQFHAGRPMGHGDVELEAARMWEKN